MVEFERRSSVWSATAASLLALLSLILGAAGTALAGTHDVYSCRMPSGEPAPTDGWRGSVGVEASESESTHDSCQERGELTASLGEKTAHYVDVGGATWTFQAPSTDPMVSGTLWRAGYLHEEPWQTTGYRLWLAGPTLAFEECLGTEYCEGFGKSGVPMSPENVIPVPSEDVGGPISINASCGAGTPKVECAREYGDPNGYAAVVYLYAADLVLEQKEGPSFSYVGGELASAPVVSGTSDVAFSASDPGAGVYQAVLTVDGHVVQRSVPDENGGECRDAGQTHDDSAAFLYLRPCAASVSADVGLDTRQLSNGAHRLVVEVTDPAGNAVRILDREITV